MKKIASISVMVIFMIVLLSSNALAHSGRTDGNGGHKDNKNASGLGSYHYHHGHGPHLHTNGVCPYSSTQSSSSSNSSSNSNASSSSEVTSIALISLSIKDMDTSIYVGDKFQGFYDYTPNNATQYIATWESSDTNIVTVSQRGSIEAIAPGSAIITVQAENGVTDSLVIEVLSLEVKSINIHDIEPEMVIDDTVYLHYDIYPENAEYLDISWLSSNPEIVNIDNNGLITAIKAGSSTLMVETDNGVCGEFVITVSDKKEEKNNELTDSTNLTSQLTGSIINSTAKESSEVDDDEDEDSPVPTVIIGGLLSYIIWSKVRNRKG